MADLRQTLRAAADPPDSIDHEQVRARARRITWWRRGVATGGAAVLVAVGVWGAGSLLDRPSEVRFVDQPSQAQQADGQGRQPDDQTLPGERGDAQRPDESGGSSVAAWATPSEAPLSPRWGAVTVWTGTRFLVWGGYANVGTPDETTAADGASYDPVADRWQMIEDAPIPGVRNGAGVWTGDEMWVLGGYGGRNGLEAVTAAAAYEPDGGTWRTLPDVPAPVIAASWAEGAGMTVAAAADPASGDLAVWTLGGDDARWRALPPLPDAPDAGGDVDPDVEVVAADGDAYVVTDAGVYVIDLSRPVTWESVGTPATAVRGPATIAAWHDGELLVVSGNRAARYVPADQRGAGAWRDAAEPPFRATRDARVAGATGAGVVVVDTVARAGAVFDADRSRWSALPRLPLERRAEAAVAAGSVPGSPVPAVLVWGGSRPTNVPFTDGAVLTPRNG